MSSTENAYPAHNSPEFMFAFNRVRTTIAQYTEILHRVKASPESFRPGAYRQIAKTVGELIVVYLNMVEFVCDQENVNADSDSIKEGNDLIAKVRAMKSVTTDQPPPQPEPPKENP